MVKLDDFQRSARDFAEVILSNPSPIDLEKSIQLAMHIHANTQGCRWPDNALELVKELPAFDVLKAEMTRTKTATEVISLQSFKEIANSLELIEVCNST